MKKIFALIMAVMLTAVLFGCGAKKEFNADEVEKKVLSTVKFENEMVSIDQKIALNNYYIEDDSVSCVSYTTPGFADEFTIFTCKDEKSADTVKTAADEYIREMTETYREYAPAEATKLEKSLVTKNGNYVIVCVTNDIENAKTIIEK